MNRLEELVVPCGLGWSEAGEGLDSRCGLVGERRGKDLLSPAGSDRGASARKKLLWNFFSEVGRSPWGSSEAALRPHSLLRPSSPSPNKRYKNDPPQGWAIFIWLRGKDLFALRLGRPSALKPHRGFIHSLGLQVLPDTYKKESPGWDFLFYGCGGRT